MTLQKHSIDSTIRVGRFQQQIVVDHKRTSESCPLRAMVIKIPVRYWSLFKKISLGKELGFNAVIEFDNLHEVMRFVGWNKNVERGEHLPYQFYLDRETSNVTLRQLIDSCEIQPSRLVIKDIESRLPMWNL